MPIQSYTANFLILQKCHISIMQYFCNIRYPNIIVIPDGMDVFEHFLVTKVHKSVGFGTTFHWRNFMTCTK